MNKKNYLIIGLGLYIIFVAIIGIRQNLLSGLPYFLKIINWILMLAYLSVGIFLIKLKNWARIFAIICAFIYFGLSLSALFVIHQKHSLLDTNYVSKTLNPKLLIHFIINLFTIYYLACPKVKEQFK